MLVDVDEIIEWKQESDYLKVSKPSKKPCDYAFVLKVETDGLEKQMALYEKNLPKEPTVVYCFPGNSLRNIGGYTVRDGNLSTWEKDTVVHWNLEIKERGTYRIDVKQKNFELERYILTVNNKEFKNNDQSTEKEFQEINLGTVKFKETGIYPVFMKADPESDWKKKYALKQIKFTKVN